MSSHHRIYIENVFAEELLELPEGVFIREAKVEKDHLVLEVVSAEDLGGLELDALYGSSDEDENHVHLGMLEAREQRLV